MLMPHQDFGKPLHLPLGRRVPGVSCSLLIALGCFALSALIAWQHPLVVLSCAPRSVQPPGDLPTRRIIMDGFVTRSLWGLFPVGREDLRSVSHFTMHTATTLTGGHSESLHAMTPDGTCEVFTGPPYGLLRLVTSLNSNLDQPSPASLAVRRAHWSWFIFSWILLLLGGLVFVRNVVIELWHRWQHRRRLPLHPFARG